MPKGWLASVLLVLGVVIAAEFAVRALLAPVGPDLWTYWNVEAAPKFEWYRQQALSGKTPEVVAVGDSLAARNFDPAAFSAAAGGVSAYNLGWPGMFPRAFQEIVPVFLETGEAPRFIILMQSTPSFIEDERVRRNEAGILSSIIARRQAGEAIAADYIALSRLYLARREVVRYWLKRKALLQRPPLDGFMPHKRPSDSLPIDPDKETMPTGGLDPGRLAVDTRLFDLAQRRGIHVIAVLPPLEVSHMPAYVDAYAHWLKQQEAEYPGVLSIWDLRDTDAVTRRDFKDSMHLWGDGAARFSSALGARFAKELSGH